MDLDCIHLVRIRTFRCDADRFDDACRRYASRVGNSIPDHDVLVAAVGIVDEARTSTRAKISSGGMDAHFNLGVTHFGLRNHWADLWRMD